MKLRLIAAGAALAIAGAASADLKLDLGGPFTFGPSQGGSGFLTFETTGLIGTLTGIEISLDFSAPVAGSWVQDFVLGVDGLSWGGFDDNFGLSDQGDIIGFPGTGAPGFYVGTGSVMNPVVYNGETATILIGNGWTSGGFTVDNVSVTLLGVTKIPAPGAIALLGLAGLTGTRRRRA